MASWTTLDPAGTLTIQQNGPYVVLLFSGGHARFFQWRTVQGGVDGNKLWIYVVSPRDSIRENFPFSCELQFEIDTAAHANQAALDFAAQCLAAARVSIGLAPT